MDISVKWSVKSCPYDIVNIEVSLTEKEMQLYQENRKAYTDFLRRSHINPSKPDGWRQFIMQSARSAEGRRAMSCYREQKRLAQAASAKFTELWRLLNMHAMDQVIIFTDDNNMAYKIGSQMLLSVITHKSKMKDRKQLLEAFREGKLKVLVTSKVLNEGVDVPEAQVGIVVSGSGAVREHVQGLDGF